MSKVLVLATSRKTRGGITSVIKAYERNPIWKEYHCHWLQTHRDGYLFRKLLYLIAAWIQYLILLPFYDIIHVHGTGGSSAKRKYPFIRLAKKFNKKIIFHFHPSSEKILFDKDSFLLQKIFDCADLILILSPQWGNWINDAFPHNHYNMKVQWNPCPNVIRSSINKKKYILFAGTIIKRKGYDVLLNAFSQISSKYPDWKLVFAGNGEIDNGRAMAATLRISSQVIWTGWLTGKDKERVFQEASIYCLASWGEGFPMGVLDAWAYGIPCVMTPVGGIPDIVKDGVNGMLFPTGSDKCLAEKLIQLIEKKALRNSIVAASDKLVYSVFSETEVNKALGEIYKSLS